MRNALAIARKELSIYFTTPWAYVVFTAMIVISSFFFIGLLRVQAGPGDGARLRLGPHARRVRRYRNLTDGVVVQLWGVVLIITLFVAPFLSMRLFAEEKRQQDLRAADDRAGAAHGDRPGQVPGRAGGDHRHPGAHHRLPDHPGASSAPRESGQRAGVVHGRPGLRRAAARGAPPAWPSGMFISSLTESQMLAALRHLRGAPAVDAAQERWRRPPRSPAAPSPSTCPSTRSSRALMQRRAGSQGDRLLPLGHLLLACCSPTARWKRSAGPEARVGNA